MRRAPSGSSSARCRRDVGPVRLSTAIRAFPGTRPARVGYWIEWLSWRPPANNATTAFAFLLLLNELNELTSGLTLRRVAALRLVDRSCEPRQVFADSHKESIVVAQ